MRKLVRIRSNARIPGDLHHKNIVLAFLKKIEMVKIAMPNFCINFLNKTVKSLSILYDFAVASLADAWIKIMKAHSIDNVIGSHPSRMRGLKFYKFCATSINIQSHPSWMRGLKLERGETEMRKTRSHPSRMRGLKFGIWTE